MQVIFFISELGLICLRFLSSVGKFIMFIFFLFSRFLSGIFYFRNFFHQLFSIGFLSLPVIGLTALFTGAALALQIFSGGSRFNAESVVPSIVAIGITRELGPVLCGLIMAGRVASAISAEIGTMKVTNQLDALYTLNTNPYNFLVIPRIFACILSLPFLTLIGDILGIWGGYLVSISSLDFNSTNYLVNTFKYLELQDVISGLIKASVFGFIIGTLGCYNGLNTSIGAKGVGLSTTNSVVWSSIFILASNYLLTEALFSK